MGRFALTFWFTITTLLGPGVCCCSLATAMPIDAGGRSSATSVKSCCDQNAPPCCPDNKHNHEPGNPSKCPCEKGKQVKTLLPAETTNADLAAQLKLIDTLFVGLPYPYSLDIGAITSATADTSQPVFRLAGRDLLAAYSQLRC